MRLIVHNRDGSQEVRDFGPGLRSAIDIKKLHDLDVVIENVKGSTRTRGNWSAQLGADYGYFPGTMGLDGDAVDVFIGPHPASEIVWIIDQVNPHTRAMDEHKVMLGFDGVTEAIAAYTQSYSDGLGWDRIDRISFFGMRGFKQWLDTMRLKDR